jgi:hypothetical protein
VVEVSAAWIRLDVQVTLRGIIPKLPRTAWIILGGDGFSAFGNSIVLPFLIIYFHQVRGIPLQLQVWRSR